MIESSGLQSGQGQEGVTAAEAGKGTPGQLWQPQQLSNCFELLWMRVGAAEWMS